MQNQKKSLESLNACLFDQKLNSTGILGGGLTYDILKNTCSDGNDTDRFGVPVKKK